jgi:hypothetical protein
MITAAILALAAFCGVLTVATIGLYRSVADVRLYLSGHRSEKGTLIADGLELPIDSGVLSLDQTGSGLLLFMRSSCPMCAELANEISTRRSSLPITIAVEGDTRLPAMPESVSHVGTDLAAQLFEMLRITETPLALLLQDQLIRGSAMGDGARSLAQLTHLWNSVLDPDDDVPAHERRS